MMLVLGKDMEEMFVGRKNDLGEENLGIGKLQSPLFHRFCLGVLERSGIIDVSRGGTDRRILVQYVFESR